LHHAVEQFGDLRPAQRRPLNIHDVLDRARRAAQAGFAAHARFSEEFDPSLPPTAGDPDQLLQVFQNLLKNAAEDAGVNPAASIHWLRHAHASHAIDNGAPITLVSQTLGHADLKTTSVYAHARPGESSGRYLKTK
jgi:nitrogen-specific signal transduction histidine kinase